MPFARSFSRSWMLADSFLMMIFSALPKVVNWRRWRNIGMKTGKKKNFFNELLSWQRTCKFKNDWLSEVCVSKEGSSVRVVVGVAVLNAIFVSAIVFFYDQNWYGGLKYADSGPHRNKFSLPHTWIQEIFGPSAHIADHIHRHCLILTEKFLPLHARTRSPINVHLAIVHSRFLPQHVDEIIHLIVKHQVHLQNSFDIP